MAKKVFEVSIVETIERTVTKRITAKSNKTAVEKCVAGGGRVVLSQQKSVSQEVNCTEVAEDLPLFKPTKKAKNAHSRKHKAR